MHGGCQAAILDEMMGSTGWHFGYSVVAAKIEVSFLEMVPYEKCYELRGKIIKVDDRKVRISAELYSGERIFANSSGLFIVLKSDQLSKLDL